MKYLKGFLLESIKDDIRDITYSVKDIGFDIKINYFWAPPLYSPFEAPNETSTVEVSGYSKCYRIKISKMGLKFEDILTISEEVQTVIDRLGDIGKTFPRINITTSKNGTISAFVAIELITSEKTDVSKTDEIINILKKK